MSSFKFVSGDIYLEEEIMRELYRVDIKKNHMDEEERKQYTDKIGLILNGEIKTADLSVKEVKNISEAVSGTADEKFIEILQND